MFDKNNRSQTISLVYITLLDSIRNK